MLELENLLGLRCQVRGIFPIFAGGECHALDLSNRLDLFSIDLLSAPMS